jgi:tRNA U38,U39,U40 pseudouridine synthase TruA
MFDGQETINIHWQEYWDRLSYVNIYCNNQRMSNGALRSGFRRYLMSVQYHGSSFLGFSIQHTNAENCILPNGTDLRGYVSVERRIRLALSAMLNDSNNQSPETESRFENIQVSSRTDSGVHALKNTFHVDFRVDEDDVAGDHDNKDVNPSLDDKESIIRRRKYTLQCTDRILRGINYYLRRTNPTSATSIFVDEEMMGYRLEDNDFVGDKMNINNTSKKSSRKRIGRRHNDTQYYCGGEWARRCPAEEVRVLAVKEAPLYMQNPIGYEKYNQSLIVDWNARFSALSRRYMYRIMHCVNEPDWGIPFEWDRSWRIYDHQNLDIDAMRIAASYLVGTNDFTTFRAAGCQRQTPVMTLYNIAIHEQPYDSYQRFGAVPSSNVANADDCNANNSTDNLSNTIQRSCHIVSIHYHGDSFLYRQVRKMTACLLEVGRGKMQPSKVRDILLERDAGCAPYTAPAHGLYLVDVEHEGIRI